MKVELNNKSKISFKGPLDDAITSSLMAIDTNPMLNAALVDVFAMVAPRTYVDAKKRNKYAGTETFFREISGTVINCFAAAYFARGLAFLYAKFVKPEIHINANTWFTNDSFNMLKHSWTQSGGNVEKYVSNVVTNMSALDGDKKVEWKDINWAHNNWFDVPSWKKFKWKNADFNNIQGDLKNPEAILSVLKRVVSDEKIDKSDAKQILDIVSHRISNAMCADIVDVKLEKNSLNAPITYVLRDLYDMGRGVFLNKSINVEDALKKIQGMNKFKSLGGIALAAFFGITNQYINRQITKKRTGKDEFVGDVGYKNVPNQKCPPKKMSAGEKSKLNWHKALAVGTMVAMAIAVMKVRNPKDFLKKLEFSAPITGGNAIKTVYATMLVGRFMAARSDTELRESCTRDYLGFLNWLVFGGFVSKGVANLLDRGRNNLFDGNISGKGIINWLYNISLKSHAQLASKGAEFAKKNIWKLNVAHAAGLLYSLLALGVFLPFLNIAITNRQHKKAYPNCQDVNFKGTIPKPFQGFV